MIRNLTNRVAIIAVVLLLAIWIDASQSITILNPLDDSVLFQRSVSPRLGLDLQGGLQVLLEADLPAGASVTADSMRIARDILEQRTNPQGGSENLITVAGERRIVGEFPGLEDAQSVLNIITQAGLLEFVDTGDYSPDAGLTLVTDFGEAAEEPTAPTPAAPPTPTPGAETTTPAGEAAAEPPTFHTVITGQDLASVSVATDDLGGYQISFSLTSDGASIFADHTAANVGKYLTILLDKQVVSSPRIQSEIPSGEGTITGNFTFEYANEVAQLLRYGSLPVPLKIVETRIVGPTLGEESLRRSLLAGAVGLAIVASFMIIYYRLPGVVAVISLLVYGLIAFAVFKYFRFTLTLPSIAGFMLSTGAALDANILVFERLKEELREGKTLVQAVDQGWSRAWPSIRDSNLAAMITSAILFWFGRSFGATIVKGFALTLGFGVAISLFTAILVTRTLLSFTLSRFRPARLEFWFGI